LSRRQAFAQTQAPAPVQSELPWLLIPRVKDVVCFNDNRNFSIEIEDLSHVRRAAAQFYCRRQPP